MESDLRQHIGRHRQRDRQQARSHSLPREPDRRCRLSCRHRRIESLSRGLRPGRRRVCRSLLYGVFRSLSGALPEDAALMAAMRILHVVDKTPEQGGVGVYADELNKALRLQGHEVIELRIGATLMQGLLPSLERMPVT